MKTLKLFSFVLAIAVLFAAFFTFSPATATVEASPTVTNSVNVNAAQTCDSPSNETISGIVRYWQPPANGKAGKWARLAGYNITVQKDNDISSAVNLITDSMGEYSISGLETCRNYIVFPTYMANSMYNTDPPNYSVNTGDAVAPHALDFNAWGELQPF